MPDTVLGRGNGEEYEHMQLTKENVSEFSDWTQGVIVQERDSGTDEVFVGVNVPVGPGSLHHMRVSEGTHVVRYSEYFLDYSSDYFNRFFVKPEKESEDSFTPHPNTGFASE